MHGFHPILTALGYRHLGPLQVLFSVMQDLRPEMPSDAELPGRPGPSLAAYKQLMESCWQPDADQRPSFEQIVMQLDEMRSADRAARALLGDAGGGSRRTSYSESTLSSPVASLATSTFGSGRSGVDDTIAPVGARAAADSATSMEDRTAVAARAPSLAAAASPSSALQPLAGVHAAGMDNQASPHSGHGSPGPFGPSEPSFAFFAAGGAAAATPSGFGVSGARRRSGGSPAARGAALARANSGVLGSADNADNGALRGNGRGTSTSTVVAGPSDSPSGQDGSVLAGSSAAGGRALAGHSSGNAAPADSIGSAFAAVTGGSGLLGPGGVGSAACAAGHLGCARIAVALHPCHMACCPLLSHGRRWPALAAAPAPALMQGLAAPLQTQHASLSPAAAPSPASCTRWPRLNHGQSAHSLQSSLVPQTRHFWHQGRQARLQQRSRSAAALALWS